MKKIILSISSFFTRPLAKSINTYLYSRVMTTTYNILPLLRYIHAIKYTPLLFNDTLQKKGITKQRHLIMSLYIALKEDQLDIVKNTPTLFENSKWKQ